MKYPTLSEQETSRQMVDIFRGYNNNLRIGDGEFFNMKNMTSDCYPVLAPRGKRVLHAALGSPNGMIAKDELCYVDGADFVVGTARVSLGLSDDPKQLISMGAYVIIMPDKKYINTKNLADFGNIEETFETTDDVRFELCTITGNLYTDAEVSDTAPANPENLALWIDTSSDPHALKRYSKSSEMWVTIATTYIKISSTSIGKQFKLYDGVTISGITDAALKNLNSTMVLWGCDDDYIIVTGILDEAITQTAENGRITVARRMPNVDFVIESENRLWGCRYGEAVNGEIVNEIYASKLGDFRNWNCFQGLSTDSYTASCGTDGPFTGAITHLGYPLFFKENCVHKVYGNYPANFQIQTTACRGVQKGSHQSLAIVNEILYYKSRSAVCAYDGSLPVEASFALGSSQYRNAVAGSHGNKYYISMQDMAGAYHLFVYDVSKEMWHREDGLQVKGFASFHGEMYAINQGNELITLTKVGAQQDILGEELVEWMVETGPIGTDMPDMKYIARLTLRMSLAPGTRVRIWVQYDSIGGWEKISSLYGTNLRSFSIPIRPRRCDHLRLRIEGEGEARIYSITKTIEQGSDIS